MTYFPCRLGVSCEIDVYGTGSDDQMRTHFERHFHFLLENCGDTSKKVIVNVYSSTGEIGRIVNGMKQEFCLSTSDHLSQPLLILEGDYAKLVL